MFSILKNNFGISINIIDKVLILIFILLNGSASVVPFQYRFVIFSLIFIFYIFFIKKFKVIKRVIPFFLIFLFVFIAQSFTLKFISWPGVINNLCRFLSGALIMSYMGNRFRYIYFEAMFLFAFFGLIFWAIYVFSGFVIDLMPSVYQKEMILWSTRPGEIRNSGPFWEPGAYAGYLLMIPLLFLDKINFFFKKNKIKCIVIILALISSMSTTGYFGFLLVLFYIFAFQGRIKFTSIVLGVILLISSWYLVNTVDFLGKKTESQFSNALKQDDEFSNTRFGALVFDVYYIKKRPIFGNGYHESTRFEDHPILIEMASNNEMGHGNGFSNTIASLGLFFFILYVYQLIKKLKVSFSSKDAWFVVVMIIILLQGEQFMLYPLFLGLTVINIKE